MQRTHNSPEACSIHARSTYREYGGIGRRIGLKIRRPWPSGFDSRHPYHSAASAEGPGVWGSAPAEPEIDSMSRRSSGALEGSALRCNGLPLVSHKTLRWVRPRWRPPRGRVRRQRPSRTRISMDLNWIGWLSAWMEIVPLSSAVVAPAARSAFASPSRGSSWAPE